jgi:hypothetical protein
MYSSFLFRSWIDTISVCSLTVEDGCCLPLCNRVSLRVRKKPGCCSLENDFLHVGILSLQGHRVSILTPTSMKEGKREGDSREERSWFRGRVQGWSKEPRMQGEQHIRFF